MRLFLSTILLVLLAYAAGFVLFVATLPDTPAAAPHADGIVELTGGEARLEAAVRLLEQGAAQRLLVSGVDLATTKETLARRVGGGARFRCCADIGYAAEDTHGNAQEAAAWAREHHFTSLVIVTARYHMPRALHEIHAAMPEGVLTAYPVEQDSIDLGGWWRRPRTTLLLHREYFKYLASLLTTRLAAA